MKKLSFQSSAAWLQFIWPARQTSRFPRTCTLSCSTKVRQGVLTCILSSVDDLRCTSALMCACYWVKRLVRPTAILPSRTLCREGSCWFALGVTPPHSSAGMSSNGAVVWLPVGASWLCCPSRNPSRSGCATNIVSTAYLQLRDPTAALAYEVPRCWTLSLSLSLSLPRSAKWRCAVVSSPRRPRSHCQSHFRLFSLHCV